MISDIIAIVVVGVAGIAVIVYLALRAGNSPQPAPREIPADEFGPVFADPREMKRFNTLLMRRNPFLAERLRTQQIIRESLQIAVTSKNKDTAESRMALAIDKYKDLRERYRIPDDELARLDAGVNGYLKKYATAKYVNEAQGYIDKIAKVKTVKTKKKYAEQARLLLEAGLLDRNADPQTLLSRLKGIPTI